MARMYFIVQDLMFLKCNGSILIGIIQNMKYVYLSELQKKNNYVDDEDVNNRCI